MQIKQKAGQKSNRNVWVKGGVNMLRSRKEMQSLINASRKALAEAETKILERNKLIRTEIAEKEQLKSKIKDLENNIELVRRIKENFMK